jgi:DNA-directed RNA polymerase specialized sigma24 family protein
VATNEELPSEQDDLLEWICEDPLVRIRIFIEERGPVYEDMATVLVRSIVGDARGQEESIATDIFDGAMEVLARRSMADLNDDSHLYNIGNLDGFIKGTMRNLILKFLDYRRRDDDRGLAVALCDEGCFASLPSNPTFVEEEHCQLLAAMVEDCLDHLKPSEKQYIETRRWLAMNDDPAEAKDIATRLNKSPQSVRTGLSTGRTKLKACLESKGVTVAGEEAR